MKRVIIIMMAILSFSQMCLCDINNFNHPPYVEDNEQIESQTVYQVKRPGKSFEEFYDVTTTKEELLIAIPSKSHDSSFTLKEEIVSEIPVAVFYDSGSEIQRNDKSIDTGSNNSVQKRARRVKKRRRPQQVPNEAQFETQKPDVNVVPAPTNYETAGDKLESTIPDNMKIETKQFRKVYKELKRTRPEIREFTPQPNTTLDQTETIKLDSSTEGPRLYVKEYKEYNRMQPEIKTLNDDIVLGRSEPQVRTRTSEVYENLPRKTVNRGQIRHKPRLNPEYVTQTQKTYVTVESEIENVASRQPVTQPSTRRRNIRPRVSTTRSSSPENVSIKTRVQENTEIPNTNTGREEVKSFVTETSTSNLYSTTAAELKETTKAIEITTQQTLLSLELSKERHTETTQLPSQSIPTIILKNKYKVQNEYDDRNANIPFNSYNGEVTKSTKNHQLDENVEQNSEITEKSIDNRYIQLNRASPKKEVSLKQNSYYTTPKVIAEYEDHTKELHRNREPIIKIINSESYVHGDTGDFHFRYEGEDGTKNFEKGQLKRFDDDITGESVSGGYSYKDKEGKEFSLSYTADENGYRPVGDHLPTPPPIPPYILRALEHLATKTTPAPVTEPIENE